MGISYSHMEDSGFRSGTSADDRLDEITRETLDRVEVERALLNKVEEIRLLIEEVNTLRYQAEILKNMP